MLTPSRKKRSKSTELLNIREEMARRRSRIGRIIDTVGTALARPSLFVALLAAHVLWIVLNLGWVPGLYVWDPPPFMLLATIASAEAPFLTLLVLMRQQRDTRINELREEVNLQVVLNLEREVSTLLRMQREVHAEMSIETGVPSDVLDQLQEPIDPEKIMDRLRESLDRAEGKPPGEEGEDEGDKDQGGLSPPPSPR